MFFDSIYYIFSFIALVSVLIAVKGSSSHYYRLAVTGCFILLLPLGYQSISLLMGTPKPIILEWYRSTVSSAQILGVRLKENEGIYLWMLVPDVEEPMSYKLPWSTKLAKQLQEAIETAKRTRRELRMKMPFETSMEDRKDSPFYSPPWPKLPDKTLPKKLIEENHPNWNI